MDSISYDSVDAYETSGEDQSDNEERTKVDNSYEAEDPEEILEFVLLIIKHLIEKVIPEIPKVLTLKKAGKCLQILGKIWNLSEYPPANYVDETMCKDTDEKLMDMEGYVDEYQYLHIQAVDQMLTDIRIIPKHFVWLLSADLSGNRLTNTSACALTKLPNIVALRLDRNRFEDPYLPAMKHLQYLSYSHNEIRDLHRIYHPNLETLVLNYNLIKKINAADCWKLTKLSQLELRGNQLTTTAGIEYASLVNLYLAENQITQLEGLQNLVNLKKLHLRNNPLSDLNGFSSSNINLEYLNIRKCLIAQPEEIKKLEMLTGLRVLIIKGNIFNPEAEKKSEKDDDDDDESEHESEDEETEKESREDDGEDDNLRIQILCYLPRLTRINKKVVTREELKNMREIVDEEELL